MELKYENGFAPVVIVVLAMIGILILGGGYVFYKNQQQQKPEEEIQNIPNSLENTVINNQAATFPDQLSSCTKYKTTFIHPLTGETLEKEILGIINGKCDYVEQMPNGGRMECKYTESDRKAAAKYYKDADVAESVGTSVTADSSGKQQMTYTINGKEVQNPLQEAVNDGICVISGY